MHFRYNNFHTTASLGCLHLLRPSSLVLFAAFLVFLFLFELTIATLSTNELLQTYFRLSWLLIAHWISAELGGCRLPVDWVTGSLPLFRSPSVLTVPLLGWVLCAQARSRVRCSRDAALGKVHSEKSGKNSVAIWIS